MARVPFAFEHGRRPHPELQWYPWSKWMTGDFHVIGLRYAAESDIGLRRRTNQDSACASGWLLAVADGMGGHAGGDVAGALIIDCLSCLDAPPMGAAYATLAAAVRAAGCRLRERVECDPLLAGMGTTLTALVCDGKWITLAHIGDSRAYLLRGGALVQLTTDHTIVQDLVDRGGITVEQAATHPYRSILAKALDGGDFTEPDLFAHPVQMEDRYLLCTDGLSGVAAADDLHRVLATYDRPETAVRELIDLANRAGGSDNVTCVVADVTDVGEVGLAEVSETIRVGAARSTPT